MRDTSTRTHAHHPVPPSSRSPEVSPAASARTSEHADGRTDEPEGSPVSIARSLLAALQDAHRAGVPF